MRWTIRKKLFLGFGLSAVLLAGSATVSRWAQDHARTSEEQLLAKTGMLRDLEHLDAYVNHVTALQRAFLISGDQKFIAPINDLRQDANVVIPRIVAATASTPQQKEAMAQWTKDVSLRRDVVNRILNARKDQGYEAAKAIFDQGEDNRLYDDMKDSLATIRDSVIGQRTELENENQHVQRLAMWIQLITVLTALLLMTAIAQSLAGSIQSNVQVAVELVGRMAEKDLSAADGKAHGEDEVAEAIDAINRMKDAMSAALGEVAHTSAQVAAAGAEIESTARQMATTTHAEKNDVEHFASSLAEMNATVREVAEHAERASLAAADAVESATEGRERVRETQTAMNQIHASVSAASGVITSLGEETRSIGEVVRIIQEIAEQTNLLALNAAIEAARAGEQGKGFAVVAQEVRQLAERTGKFTKEIAVKVQAVQNGSERAVNSMQEGEEVVNRGVDQFTQVTSALDAIMDRIENAREGIAMIATATTEQSSATESLTENIHRISTQVNQTATQVDQTAAACEELSKLASMQQAVVNGFRLPDEPGGSFKRR